MSELIALAWPIVALVGIGVATRSARGFRADWTKAEMTRQETAQTRNEMSQANAEINDIQRRLASLEKQATLPPAASRGPARNVDAFR